MADRASVFEGVQIGLETSPGGSVSADKKLGALSITPRIRAEVSTFRPMGMKYPTLTALNKEWVEATLQGEATYSEVVYPLASLMTLASITDLGGSPKAWSWNFLSASSAADAPKTFTVEQGDAERTVQFAYGLVTGMKFNFDRSGGVTLEGNMIGQALVDDVTPTGSPTTVELIPILASQVDVYLDDTYAGLGSTKLTRAKSGSWELTDRYGPLWTLNSAVESYAAHVETEPKCLASIILEADDAGMGLLDTMRAGDTKYLRIQAQGLTISGSYKYSLTIDVAVKMQEPGEFRDSDGLYAVEWPMVAVYDAAWGKAFDISVINKQEEL